MFIKRDFETSGWSNSGARWAFFAVFILLIIIVVFGTIRVNKKRTQAGVQPIYGTRWMTPPLYRQSQTHYNQPQGANAVLGGSYVPTYTATANEYDMGYYDNNGEFHPNPNSKSAHIPGVPPAHHRNPSDVSHAAPAQRIPSMSDASVQRPAGPPPASEDIDDEDDDLYRRPHGAPPPSSFAPPSSPPPTNEPIEGSSLNADSLPSFTEGSNPPVVKEKS